MFDTQSKTTRHAQRQENSFYNEEKLQSVETNPELTQMSDTADDIKAVITTVFHMFRKLKKRLNILNMDTVYMQRPKLNF